MDRIKLKGERGAVLILVLILLLVGSLIIIPLLSFMVTGLKTGQAYEQRMYELYAADAGINDGIWRVKHGLLPDTPYRLDEDVNRKEVWITPEPNTMKRFFIDLLNLPPGHENAVHPHGTEQADWVLIYSVPEPDTYNIEIEYQGKAQNVQIASLGAWLWGQYDYVEGSASGITTAPPTSEEPDSEYDKYFGGGTAFIWDLAPTFWFGQQSGIYNASQTFRFTLPDGSIPSETPWPNVGWAGPKRSDIWISWLGTVAMSQLSATASSPDTSASTTIESSIFSEEIDGQVVITVLTWEVSNDS